jgi:hypothetical protein
MSEPHFCIDCECAKIDERQKLVHAIDARIDPLLEHFLPFACHDGPCKKKTKDRAGSCCWHFSSFLHYSIGCGAIIAWLQTYVERGEPLYTMLEDFATLASVLNDKVLVANLAYGIVCYFDALIETAKDNRECCKSAHTRLKVLECTGWSQHVSNQSLEIGDLLKGITEPLQRRRQDFQLLLTAGAPKKSRDALLDTLLAPYCLDKENWVGDFFLGFFGLLLPDAELAEYHTSLLRFFHYRYSPTACSRLIATDGLKSDAVAARRTRCSKRSVIEAERKIVKSQVEMIRLRMLRFVHNYVGRSNKLVAFVHIMPASLLFMNHFRLHMYGCAPSIKAMMTFSYYDMLNGGSLCKRSEADPAVVCAPYCFNCGAFMHDVWPAKMQHTQLSHTLPAKQKTQTFLCGCNMARYCSKRCAELHAEVHGRTCFISQTVSSTVEKEDVEAERDKDL